MSDKFLPADDVTMELATVLDEFSAVDTYRLRKEPPIQKPTKKALSYKTIIRTKFPVAAPSDPTHKLPDSINMEYLDMLSGKNVYTPEEEGQKIPISIESFEKLCYYPELTKTQKQEICERAREEAERLQMLEDAEDAGCYPCCNSKPSSPKEKKEDLAALLNFDDESWNEAEEEKDVSQQTESPIPVPALESEENSPEVFPEQNFEEKKGKKKRKSIFQRALSSIKEKSKKTSKKSD